MQPDDKTLTESYAALIALALSVMEKKDPNLFNRITKDPVTFGETHLEELEGFIKENFTEITQAAKNITNS